MKKYKIIIICAIAALLPFNIFADDNAEKLSLLSVVKDGLENNFNIRLKKSDIKLLEGKLLTNKGRFNPFINLNLKSNNGNDPTITYSDLYNAETEIVLPTKYGLSLYTGIDFTKETVIEPTHMTNNIAGGFLGLNVPLLKIGSNNIVNAEYEGSLMRLKAENTAFSHEVTAFIRDAATAYILLYQDASVFRLLKQRLDFIREYKDNIAFMIKNEQIPKSELLRAEAVYNKVQIALTDAEQQLQESYYKMYEIIGLERRLNEQTVPAFAEDYPDFNKMLFDNFSENIITNSDSIIKQRLDYLSLKQKTTGIERELSGAENQMMHDLDFAVAVNYFGYSRGNDFAKLFSTMTGKFPGASVTLSLKYKFPFQNDVNEGIYTQKLSEYETTKIGLEQLKFEVKNQMLITARNLVYYSRLTKDQLANVDLYYQTYLNEFEKFKMALATQIDVLNSMEDYFDEQIKLESYKAAVGINLVVLKYLAGKLPSNSDDIEKFDLWQLN